MFKNYLKVAIRNLRRQKLFSFINIFGLSLSMSVCLLVLIHIKEQIGYDNFHPHSDRIYRVITELNNKQGNTFRFASSPLPLGKELADNYTFIDQLVRLYSTGVSKAQAEKKEINISTAFTEASFFDVFGFRLKEGVEKTAFSNPNSIVLSSETAEKFFGNENPVGKMIELPQFGSFQITGVLEKPAGKSHLEQDAYCSMSSIPQLEKTGKLTPALDQWDMSTSGYTYVLLKENASKRQLTSALFQIQSKLLKESQATLHGKESFAFEAQPFDKIILGEELGRSLGNVGSRGKMLAEVLIGLIILLSACFNYTNLSIARSLNRGKEVGVRKVAGAARYQLFQQFITESVLIAFLALGGAYLLLKAMMAWAPFIGELDILNTNFDFTLCLWFVLFAIFTGIVAGALPAWALSSFKPIQVLKNLSNIKLFGGNNFRKVLLILQFSLALVIIIFTSIASKQFNFISHADPGYDRDNVLVVSLQGTDAKLLSNDINSISGVENVAASSAAFGANSFSEDLVKKSPGADPVKMKTYDAETNLPELMGLQIIAGQEISTSVDSAKEQFVTINETASRLLGYSTSADAVGKMIWINDSTPVQVAAVLKDFSFQTVAVPIMPMLLRNRVDKYNLLLVKTTSSDKKMTAAVEQAWKKTGASTTFNSSWLRNDLYEKQSAWGTVSMLGMLSFMAITIACLGLLGMVIYNVETRRKEIGVRKVMGASVSMIVLLLSRSFLKLVLIAALIAIPIGYLCGYFFLNIFATRVQIGLGILIFSLLGMLLIVMITIGSQVFKAAVANPVNSLRNE